MATPGRKLRDLFGRDDGINGTAGALEHSARWGRQA
jgi:hypothetical protein